MRRCMNGHHKKRILHFVILSLVLSVVVFNPTQADEQVLKKVYVIPISGTVDPGMSAFLKRAFRDISEDRDALFVIEMDTFGGRVDSALQMVETLLNVPKGKTIAFVSTRAISAGALIALACNELVMKHHTTIGDCAPISYSSEGPKMLGEKFQSPLRAKFRSLAKRNGYPETLAEAMVTAELEVYEVVIGEKTLYMDAQAFDDLSQAEKEKVSSKKTIVAKGELLTMEDTEAVELGFSKMSVANIDEMLHQMGIENYDIIRIEESWSESLVRLIDTIAPILMMIGLAALYTEVKAPGFGLPGIIGITCLALVFLNQYLVGLADYTELIIIGIGIVLMGFEIFVIPGFGITGIAGLIFIAVGLVLALQDFVIPDPSFPWQKTLLTNNIIKVLGAFLSAVLAALFLLRYVLPRLSRVVEGPYLTATLEKSHADSIEAMKLSVGETGIAMTFLRPSGKVKIKGEIFDVVTEGEFMEKGTPVVISKIKGSRVIVSRMESK
jgi:membrane-bound serine protease (ClpP class)